MTTHHTGGGDPDSTLRLLWRAQLKPPARSRGPIPARSVDDLVHAALLLADEQGLAAVSVRTLARSLGMAPMSVYTHVPGKAGLLDLMLDGLYLSMPRPAWLSRSWRSRVAAVAAANRDLLDAHPWLTELASLSRPPLGPGQMAKYEHELAALDGTGLTDVQVDAALTLVLGFVHQQVRARHDAERIRGATGLTDAQWWAANAPLLGELVGPGDYPRATRIGEAAGRANDSAYHPDRAWDFGLTRVLDGLAVLVQREPA